MRDFMILLIIINIVSGNMLLNYKINNTRDTVIMAIRDNGCASQFELNRKHKTNIEAYNLESLKHGK